MSVLQIFACTWPFAFAVIGYLDQMGRNHK